jgi:hypothetical protein
MPRVAHGVTVEPTAEADPNRDHVPQPNGNGNEKGAHVGRPEGA